MLDTLYALVYTIHTKEGDRMRKKEPGTKIVMLRGMPSDVHEKLRIQAVKEHRSHADIIVDALRLYFKAIRKGRRN